MDGKRLRRYFWIIAAVQVLIFGIFAFYIQMRERTIIEPALDTWHAWLAEYEDGVWYIDESAVEGIDSNTVEMIYGPYLHLDRGSYAMRIEYLSDEDNRCALATGINNLDNSVCLKADDVVLDPGSAYKELRFEITDDIDNFEVKVFYNCRGNLRIDRIVIWETKARDLRNLFYLLLVFLLLDVLMMASDFVYGHRAEIGMLLAIIFLVSLPQMVPDFYYGHDIYFHLLRIEGIAEGLKLGSFPVRLNTLFLEGYGYPVSIYYGDFLLYVPAVLRLIGFSVIEAYKIYIFLIHAGTVLVGYLCLKKIFCSPRIGMIGTLVYVTASYRMLDIYERAAVGEYTSMMILPVISLAVYQIYTSGSYEDWKQYKKNAWLLSIGMSFLICTHVLSTEMVVWFLVIICVIFFRKTFRRNTLKVYGLAVLYTLFFSLYFLVPFFECYLAQDVNITSSVGNSDIARIQGYGAYIAQYFTFFEDPRGLAGFTVMKRMQLTPGPVLMAALPVALLFLASGRKNKRCLFYTVMSLLALFLASNLFPWDYLAARISLFNLLAQVQYPWRYIGIAVLFLTLLLCELFLWIEKLYGTRLWKIEIVAAAAVVLMTCYTTGGLFDSLGFTNDLGVSSVMKEYDTASLDTDKIGAGEYLRVGTKLEDRDGEIHMENVTNLVLLSEHGADMQLHVETGENTAYIDVPRFRYRGYRVRDGEGNEYVTFDGVNNVVAFHLPKHFNGDITITFEEPLEWRAAELISLLFALWAAAMWLRGIRQCGAVAGEE